MPKPPKTQADATEAIYTDYLPLSELLKRYHPQNPKDHDIGFLIISLQEFGYVTPGVLDEKTGLFAEGHGRTQALNEMKTRGLAAPERIRVEGGEWFVPVNRGISFKTPEQLRAYLIASNRGTELGGWDESILLENLKVILADGGDKLLMSTGYDADDMSQIERFLNNQTTEQDSDFDKTVQQQLEVFNNNTIKQVVLYFDTPEYLRVVDRLARLGDELKLRSNTDVFLHLLDFYDTHEKDED